MNEDFTRMVMATCTPRRRPVREWISNWGGCLAVVIAWFALVAVLANANACLGWLLGGAK